MRENVLSVSYVCEGGLRTAETQRKSEQIEIDRRSHKGTRVRDPLKSKHRIEILKTKQQAAAPFFETGKKSEEKLCTT